MAVTVVSLERWELAQQAECALWFSPLCLSRCDDRNADHAERFDNYNALKGGDYGDVIEVGCGPFTNMRLILPHLSGRYRNVHLLDPLISKYAEHPHSPIKSMGATLHPVAIERFEPDRTFDLVIMINTLAHCMNAEYVFAKLDEILAPDGILVFSEFSRSPNRTGDDLHHPIIASMDRLLEFARQYDWMYSKTITGLWENRTDLYVIAKKQS